MTTIPCPRCHGTGSGGSFLLRGEIVTAPCSICAGATYVSIDVAKWIPIGEKHRTTERNGKRAGRSCHADGGVGMTKHEELIRRLSWMAKEYSFLPEFAQARDAIRYLLEEKRRGEKKVKNAAKYRRASNDKLG